MKKTTTVLISSIFTILMMASCGGNPSACDFLKNPDRDFQKKCNEYEASLSTEESAEWINKLKDCKE